MNFLTDRELFADLDENGQFTKRAKTDDTLGSWYRAGIINGAENVRGDGKVYSKKDWKGDNKEWLYEVWEWGDASIERYLSKKKKGITVGEFPMEVEQTGKYSTYIKSRLDADSGEFIDKKAGEMVLEVDYFDNLSECLDRLGGKSDHFTHSLRGYFKDIMDCRKALSELTENYIGMKKTCRWILFAAIWMLLCISPTIPGIPPFMQNVTQAVMGKVGEKVAMAIFIAPLVLQILACFFHCICVADDFSLLFWLNFPVVTIAVGLCGALGVIGGMEELEGDYIILAWVLAGIYLFWLFLLLLVVLYVRHVEGKKRKEQPEKRKAFVKAVDANAAKIHRYIRLRVLWWKHINGSRSLPYCLTRLQELLDECVKEAEKYRNMI